MPPAPLSDQRLAGLLLAGEQCLAHRFFWLGRSVGRQQQYHAMLTTDGQGAYAALAAWTEGDAAFLHSQRLAAGVRAHAAVAALCDHWRSMDVQDDAQPVVSLTLGRERVRLMHDRHAPELIVELPLWDPVPETDTLQILWEHSASVTGPYEVFNHQVCRLEDPVAVSSRIDAPGRWWRVQVVPRTRHVHAVSRGFTSEPVTCPQSFSRRVVARRGVGMDVRSALFGIPHAG